MEPKSTVQNSRAWRLCHGFNYFVGGGTFLVGSVILFPLFAEYFDTAQVSAWLYTIGSATFLLADFTEWLHYLKSGCPFLQLALNFFISVCGSALYLVGSACFIPSLDLAWLGELMFIIGSALIILSQGWKIYRVLNQKGKSVQQSINEDQSGFYVDFFAGLGGVMYFVGTFIFQESAFNPNFLIPAVTMYSFGGVFFFGSALFMQKRYHFQQTKEKGYASADSTVTTVEI